MTKLCVFSHAFVLLGQSNMCFSICVFSILCPSLVPLSCLSRASLPASYLFALTFCLFRAMCSPALSCWPFFRASFRLSVFTALSCQLWRLPALSSELSNYISQRSLSGYTFSRAFLPVMCLPALSSRLCIDFVISRSFLAGYIFSRASCRLFVYSRFLAV